MSSHRYSPCIVVLAHRRRKSLHRLLNSLERGIYPSDAAVPLYISVDGGDEKVVSICENMKWPYGSKTVLKSEESVGVRNHVFNCCSLLEKHDSLIMLEDDLYVTAHFYEFALKALSFYNDDDEIGGGALYHHQLNETAKRKFSPVTDGNDVYFLQLAASWGQFWTSSQWKRFKSWSEHKTNSDIESVNIPWDIKKWPWSSWKKWFTAYLVDQERYVVYPRFSLTTNFMESGTHNPKKGWDLQTELDCTSREWRFKKPADSIARYDAYCEIEPSIIKRFNPHFRNYDFEVDLFGVKQLSSIHKPHILTTRKVANPLFGFERSLRPAIMNVLHDLHGSSIQLAELQDVVEDSGVRLRSEINYYFGVPDKLLGKSIYQHLENASLWVGLKVFTQLFFHRIRRFLHAMFASRKQR